MGDDKTDPRRGRFRTRDDDVKVSQVVVVRDGRDPGWRIGDESLRFLVVAKWAGTRDLKGQRCGVFLFETGEVVVDGCFEAASRWRREEAIWPVWSGCLSFDPRRAAAERPSGLEFGPADCSRRGKVPLSLAHRGTSKEAERETDLDDTLWESCRGHGRVESVRGWRSS